MFNTSLFDTKPQIKIPPEAKVVFVSDMFV